MAAATALRPEFADGVWFVPLAPIVDPSLVAPTIAQVLGIRQVGDHSIAERLRARLHHRQALLVIDNFEQVVAAAPVLSDLLIHCPRLKALVTSRTPLDAYGERSFPTPPLSLPRRETRVESRETDGLSLDSRLSSLVSDAVRLFVVRAQAVQPDFALTATNAPAVDEICRRLDGLPLAIELAAARTRLLSPAALLARLESRLILLTGGPRDLPDRHRTMRDAIAWSYDLLTPEEQIVFRHLAIFVDGFSLVGAEAVGGSFDAIAALTQHSLLQRDDGRTGEPRFHMLETVREFGLEQLGAHGEAPAARAAHAAFFLVLAERAEEAHWGSSAGDWHEATETEHGNLRAAMSWAIETGHDETIFRLANALELVWWGLGHGSDARRWLERALAADSRVPAELRSAALAVAGRLAIVRGDCELAVALIERSLELADASDQPAAIARAHDMLGLALQSLGHADEALAHSDEAVARFRALGNRGRLAGALCQLATLGDFRAVDGQVESDDLDRGVRCCEEALALFREIGQSLGIARALHGLAYLAYKRRDYAAAVPLEQETLKLRWDRHDMWDLPASLENLADSAGATGQAERAARLYGASAAMRELFGVPMQPVYLPEHEREMEIARAALGDASFAATFAAGQALSADQAVAEALALTIAAELAVAADSAAKTADLTGLTPRERDVLRLLAGGRSNREIAGELFIGVATIKWHVTAILGKLGVETRAAAIALAHRAGLVDPPAPASDR